MSDDLADYQEAYDRLKAQIQPLGFICSGTVLLRYRPCGKPSCRCHANPPQLHGPYYQLTRKVKGKTVTVQLNRQAGPLYAECMANRRRLQTIIDQMEALSLRAITAQLEGKS